MLIGRLDTEPDSESIRKTCVPDEKLPAPVRSNCAPSARASNRVVPASTVAVALAASISTPPTIIAVASALPRTDGVPKESPIFA